MEMKDIIRKNLKAFRSANGYSQDEVAGYLDISREMISYFENGVRVPSASQLQKICDLYGIEMSELLEESAERLEENVALAFRSEVFTPEDLQYVSAFKRIIKNYLKLDRLAQEYGL